MTNNIGKLITLFVSVKDVEGRVKKEKLTLDAKGITEDKYYNKDIHRSILITSKESYILANKNNIDMPYGSEGSIILII